MRRPLVVLDTESATPAGPPHLLELAAVRVDGGEAQEHFASLVRPQVPVDPATSDVHGLVDDDVRDAPDTGEVLRAFREFARDDWLVAHCASSDAHVLAFEFARWGLEPPPGPVLDTVVLTRRVFPEAPDHRLATLVEWLGIEERLEHRALPDAVACAQVLDRCLRHLGGWDAVEEGQLLRTAGAPLTLRAATPRPPSDRGRGARRGVIRALERARREGARVRLVYGELGTDTARLEVLPGLLFRSGSRGYLEAECARSGSLKTYRLDRIHRVDPLE